MTRKIPFQDFFCGSGLVSYGLGNHFEAVWANDVSRRKQAVYEANLGSSAFVLDDIAHIKGADVPQAELSWASFPCQDLSLAGRMGGIRAARSGLVWEWLRIMHEMGDAAPAVVCLENVTGLVSAAHGQDYRTLHHELADLGYRAGVIMLNADRFVPQSRPRVFVIATRGRIPDALVADGPTWLQTPAIRRVAATIEGFVWWSAPQPEPMTAEVADIVVPGIPYDRPQVVALVPDAHVRKFLDSGREYATGYRRTRNHRQVLELRCDGIAGCLRTPGGGSSKQFLVHKRPDGGLEARLLTVREVARLMGAPDSWQLPGSENDGYAAMGDAVAVPVAAWVASNFLRPLAEAEEGEDGRRGAHEAA